MCGIFGIFSKQNIDKKQAEQAFLQIQHRGKDGTGSLISENNILFHCLHAVVGNVKQPLISGNETFMTNCEIYNWKELNNKYSFSAKNDAELFFLLLHKRGIVALEELEGPYAFFYQKENVVTLGRDILGEKPLCYIHTPELFAFASEAKALMRYAKEENNVKHLLPTELLQYNVRTHTFTLHHRTFFSLPEESKERKENLLEELEQKFVGAVKERVANLDHLGILFSGGIDSTLLAFLCKKLGKNFTCYTAAFADGNTRDAPDLLQAQKVAKQLGFPLKTIIVDGEQTEKAVKEVVRIIETTDVVKVGVALPFYLCAKQAAADGNKVLLSGLGSEELFAGYQRHLDVLKKNCNVNAECLQGLSQLWERDLYRDDLVTMANTIELRLPFLDYELIRFALSIPAKWKIDETENGFIQKVGGAAKGQNSFDGTIQSVAGGRPIRGSSSYDANSKNFEAATHERSEFLDEAKQNKKILREAAQQMGIPEEIASRKKIAAQYGSNFDKALEKLAKKAGCKSKKEYLESMSKKETL